MTSVTAVGPWGDRGRESAAKRLWDRFLDVLVGFSELPPEPDALELSEAVRQHRSATAHGDHQD